MGPSPASASGPLRRLRESQKLPWVEVDGARACALVEQAIALHERLGTVPPPEFARWRKSFADWRGERRQRRTARAPETPRSWIARLPCSTCPSGGWFLDPARVGTEALALLQVGRAAGGLGADQGRARGGHPRRRDRGPLPGPAPALGGPALRDGRDLRHDRARRRSDARRTVAAALADASRPATAIPFVRALAARGLEMAAEVALGRARLDEVTRAPVRRARE